MSDGTMTAGTVDAPVNAGTAPEVVPDAGATTPETEQQAGTASEAGPDGGSVEGQAGRQRGKSVYSQVRELNAKLREQRSYWESEIGQLKAQLDEFRNGAAGRQDPKPRKTFFEAPEDVLAETLNSHLSEFEKRMASKFEQTQMQREQASLRAQEVSEAAKFIKSQKGMTEDDIQDIREILQSNPQLENLSPMDQAEFALYKWQKERGIGDNTAKKNRASTVTGAPPAGGGPKMWTESEIEKEMSNFPPNVANWTKDDEARFKKLDDEIRRAYREKRVSK